MNFEKYTERARGFVQSAQSLAMREGHPQFAPGHVLKVLLDDPEGLCAGLIDRAGGRSREAHAAVEQWLAKQPKVSGAASQPQATRELMRFFDTAEKAAEKAGDSFVTVERLLLALAIEKDTRGRQDPGPGRRHRRRASTRRSTRCARAAPPTTRRPRTPMTR